MVHFINPANLYSIVRTATASEDLLDGLVQIIPSQDYEMSESNLMEEFEAHRIALFEKYGLNNPEDISTYALRVRLSENEHNDIFNFDNFFSGLEFEVLARFALRNPLCGNQLFHYQRFRLLQDATQDGRFEYAAYVRINSEYLSTESYEERTVSGQSTFLF